MKLLRNINLAYCTNVHRGETWQETFSSLKQYCLDVRDRICPDRAFAIGLRLSAQAARELSDTESLEAFRRWLDAENCYVFTINGFPYGKFHGGRVKEQVYLPDWSSKDRLNYTVDLFKILAALLPEGEEGSVSTLPGSFKEFMEEEDRSAEIRKNLDQCVQQVAELSRRSGKSLHLGIEPEPLGMVETSLETVELIQRIREESDNPDAVSQFLGVNYDTCHLAVEFEKASDALRRFIENEILISKIHLSSAMRVKPTPSTLELLESYSEDTYLHQVISRSSDSGELVRYRDLPPALEAARHHPDFEDQEWRIHFHIPLHYSPDSIIETTADHIRDTLDVLAAHPGLCHHLEMETYTWEVLPESMKSRSVVEQIVEEYHWALGEAKARGLAD